MDTVGEVKLMLTKGMLMIIIGVLGVLITIIIILFSLIRTEREKRAALDSRNIDYSSLNICDKTELGSRTRN